MYSLYYKEENLNILNFKVISLIPENKIHNLKNIDFLLFIKDDNVLLLFNYIQILELNHFL